ncbi:MAG: UTP--glucose-1-phosphate uridylyltransferase, partial [Chitinophagales bacterium]|nr:UTP--glucose-1-phosphate uridylyltransferase [Hyphomicrobiales bacterium]
HQYGVVSVGEGDGRLWPVNGMVEKPPKGTAPSNLIIMGRYILQPEIFDLLSTQEKGAGGEIQITDAMKTLMETQPFYALKYEGRSYDCGSKLGFLQANVAFALESKELGEKFGADIIKIAADLQRKA